MTSRAPHQLPPIEPDSPLAPFFVGPHSPILQFLAGVVFFPSLFLTTRWILGRVSSPDSLVSRFRTSLAVRVVSAVQAVVATATALSLLNSCSHVIYSSHWATTAYVRFSAPYFLYDILAMYAAFSEMSEKESRRPSWLLYLRHDVLIVAHHLFIPLLIFPAILAPWRRDRGDYLVGCFYLLEASTPFVSLRAALHQLQLSRTRLYVVNGLLMMGVFAVCRILIFPYIYWSYSRHNISGVAMPVWRVPLAIPWHCNVSCSALFLLQLYWFLKMVKGAVKLINGKRTAVVAADAAEASEAASKEARANGLTDDSALKQSSGRSRENNNTYLNHDKKS